MVERAGFCQPPRKLAVFCGFLIRRASIVCCSRMLQFQGSCGALTRDQQVEVAVFHGDISVADYIKRRRGIAQRIERSGYELGRWCDSPRYRRGDVGSTPAERFEACVVGVDGSQRHRNVPR